MKPSRPRFLVVAPYVPSATALHAGGRASAVWLEELQELGEVDLVALAPAAGEAAAAAPWPGLHEVTLVAYRSGWFRRLAGAVGDLARGGAGGVHARLRAVVRGRLAAHRYAAVLVEHEETALFLELTRRATPLWLDCHDVISGHFEHDPAANPVPRLIGSAGAARAAETRLLRDYDLVMARSAADRARLVALAPEARVELLRHPVELPAEVAPRARRAPRGLLLTGSFRRAPNVAAARAAMDTVLPLLRARYPDITLDVVGDGAADALRAGGRGVRVFDRQADLAPHYAGAMVFLNPTPAAGGVITRHLDALAHGLPVVTTPAGAEGLDMAGAVLTGGTPGELAAAVARLLDEPDLWGRLAGAGRAAVEERHAPGAVRRAFREIVAQGMAPAPAERA